MYALSRKTYDPCSDRFISYEDYRPYYETNQFCVGPPIHSSPPIRPSPGAYNSQVTTKPSSSFFVGKAELKDTPDAHIVKVELPGLKREEVKVELEEGGFTLCIVGERKVEKEDRGGNHCHVEHSTSRFVHRITLPEKAKADRIRAKMDNGVLTITICKKEIKKTGSTQTIPIC